MDWITPALLFLRFRVQRGDMLAAKLDEFAADSPSIPYLQDKQARWVKPLLVVKVRHLAGSRYLRHAMVRELFLP
jgi:hypothetical protein